MSSSHLLVGGLFIGWYRWVPNRDEFCPKIALVFGNHSWLIPANPALFENPWRASIWCQHIICFVGRARKENQPITAIRTCSIQQAYDGRLCEWKNSCIVGFCLLRKIHMDVRNPIERHKNQNLNIRLRVVSFRVQTSRFIRVRNSNFVRVDQHNVAKCNCAWSHTKRHIVKKIDINCFQSHKLKTWHVSVNVHNLRPAVAFDVQSVRTNISKMQTEIATFGRPGGKHIRAPQTNSCNSSRTTDEPKTIKVQDSAAQESKHANPLMNMPI